MTCAAFVCALSLAARASDHRIEDVHGTQMVGHGGGFPGVSIDLVFAKSAPWTVVVLANQDPTAAQMISETAKAFAATQSRR